MSIRFDGDLDLEGQLLLAQAAQDATAIANGAVVYRVDTHTVRAHINGTWQDLATSSEVVTGQSYRHSQGIPSDTWTINHNLGYRPGGVLVQDSGGTDNEPSDIEHVDVNTTILYFSSAFGGTAELS